MIGIDFDNTIACYDGVFHRIAKEHGWINDETPTDKRSVRDRLRADGREEDWIHLQGEVYGARMDVVRPFEGVLDFFRECSKRSLPICIISHKTRHPFRGPKHDLHQAAWSWLEDRGFFDASAGGLDRSQVFFELTKEDKLARIGRCGCQSFVDDLPEFLAEPSFPSETEPVLFDPEDVHVDANHKRALSWAALRILLIDRAA